MSYYIRYIQKKEYAQNDLNRGWSMVTADEDRDYLETLLSGQEDGWGDIVEHPFIKNMYAIRLNGLCGYGPYDSIEDAESDAVEMWSDSEPWHEESDYVAIYTGTDAGWDGMAGELFDPEEIVKIIRRGNG